MAVHVDDAAGQLTPLGVVSESILGERIQGDVVGDFRDEAVF